MGSIRYIFQYKIFLFLVSILILPLLIFAQDNNIARIEQVGNNNLANQNQTGTNLADILQENVYSNTARQTQSGISNIAAIVQNTTLRNSTAIQEQSGENNAAKIIQRSGSGNYAEQYQQGNSNNGLSELLNFGFSELEPLKYGAFIQQNGSQCRAIQRQIGDNNFNYIQQNGSGQEAEVNQYGSGFKHILIQEETYTGPKYEITQQVLRSGGLSKPATIIIRQK